MRRSAWQRTITDSAGVPVTGVQINVYLADGITPATIFSSAAGAALTNPFTTATAIAKFFANPGVYVIKATKDSQVQTFADEEIGAINYRLDQGALGGYPVNVADITNDSGFMNEGGAFRFLNTAIGKPSFADNGLIFAAPYDGGPSTNLIGIGLRPTTFTRVAFIGRRNALGSAPQYTELWDKGINPAQTHLIDVGGGAAMQTAGSFGVGGTSTAPQVTLLSGTLDTTTMPSGIYRAVAADTGNKPAGYTDFNFLNMRYNGTDQTRIALGTTGECFTFASAGGVWNSTGWRRQYDSLNAQGTVSHDGTKNTGAIMEYGSNANGIYYKYLDGRLECIFTRSNVAMVANTDDAYAWTFPAAFIAAPACLDTKVNGGSVTNTFNVNKTASANQTTTGATMRTNVSASQNHTLTHVAIGRWRA